MSRFFSSPLAEKRKPESAGLPEVGRPASSSPRSSAPPGSERPAMPRWGVCLSSVRGASMNRTTLNFVVDTAAFVGFVLLTTTGVLMHYLLPPGSGHRTTIWGLDRHDWGQVHFWISAVF